MVGFGDLRGLLQPCRLHGSLWDWSSSVLQACCGAAVSASPGQGREGSPHSGQMNICGDRVEYPTRERGKPNLTPHMFI